MARVAGPLNHTKQKGGDLKNRSVTKIIKYVNRVLFTCTIIGSFKEL